MQALQSIVDWFHSLSNGLKVLLIIVAVVIAVLASSPLAVLAGVVFLIGIVAIIVQAIRRRPIKQWGIATLSALVLSFILGGVANALYGSFTPQQQQQASTPPSTTEPTSEQSVAQETTRNTAASRKEEHASKNPPTPPASQKKQSEASGTTTSSYNAPQGQKSTTEDPYPHFSDGTWQVGKDIQPGTYRTSKGSSGCYYARLKGFSGELNDILANDNTDAPAVVTITPTDAGFEAKRCGTWTQDLSQITTSKTSFGDGPRRLCP